MRRWTIAFGVAILAALAVLLTHSSNPSLLVDSDTSVLLHTIRAKNAPFSWFAGDWPLANHFYRPMATLTFEMDARLYGNNAAGYGWTNAALAACCVLLLFWFLREFTDRHWFAAAGAALFAYWQSLSNFPLDSLTAYLALLTLIVGVFRHKTDWLRYVPAFFVLWYLGYEIQGLISLNGTVIGWLPGRTASTMTIFALASMASYARFERLRGRTEAPLNPTPLTPPATRSSRVAKAQGVVWPWALLAVLLGAGAFASYEQAIMLPGCLLAIAISFRCLGYRPSWVWQIPFWSLLVGYYLLRLKLIPHGVSGYQQQQFRTSIAGPALMISDLVFRPAASWSDLVATFEIFWVAIVMGTILKPVLFWVSGLVAYWEMRKEWVYAVAGWGMSLLAYLPMAWFKTFNHYYYWPMALRTVFVVTMASVAWRLASTAWSPPERQAPSRPYSAPGSLPHR